MISHDELRPNNYILTQLQVGCREFDIAIIKVKALGSGQISYLVDYPDSESLEEEYASLEDLTPIPLNRKWKELLNVNFEFPSWIKHVHELQNWYYWANGKKELDDSKIPISEGDNVPNSHLEELIKEG
ncbi:hypothetical protein J4422_02880 [Candidatus Pacearchaeota archaeon]|nr:hypothetical protein [Candidatus Pacearchaeota archaeon]